MTVFHLVVLAATRHMRGGAIGILILVVFLGAIVWLAVLWSKAKSRADRAEAELSSLRSAYDHLSARTTPPDQASSTSPPSAPSTPRPAPGPPPFPS